MSETRRLLLPGLTRVWLFEFATFMERVCKSCRKAGIGFDPNALLVGIGVPKTVRQDESSRGVNTMCPVELLCPAGSEKLSRAFYCDLLGLVEIAKPPSLVLRGGCWFQGDGVEVRLRTGPVYGSNSKQSTTLVSFDLDGLAERLTAAGCPVTWDEDGLPVRGFSSVDPHGNPLVFSVGGRSR